MSDSELIRGLRQHDATAFQRVRDRYLPSVWRYVLTRVDQDPHVAEDIVSETMLALIQAFDSSATDVEIVNLGAWLRSVANHKVQDYYRAAARVRHLVDGARQQARESDPASDPARQEEIQERRLQVRRTMDQLPEQYRMGLEWKYLDKLSVREISDRWGTTEKAAESILFRARRAFRDALKKKDLAASAEEPCACRPPSPLNVVAEDNRRNIPRTACDVSEQ